jgi:hypothetical protein
MRTPRKLAVSKRLRQMRKNLKKMSFRRQVQFNSLITNNES